MRCEINSLALSRGAIASGDCVGDRRRVQRVFAIRTYTRSIKANRPEWTEVLSNAWAAYRVRRYGNVDGAICPRSRINSWSGKLVGKLSRGKWYLILVSNCTDLRNGRNCMLIRVKNRDGSEVARLKLHSCFLSLPRSSFYLKSRRSTGIGFSCANELVFILATTSFELFGVTVDASRWY